MKCANKIEQKYANKTVKDAKKWRKNKNKEKDEFNNPIIKLQKL